MNTAVSGEFGRLQLPAGLQTGLLVYFKTAVKTAPQWVVPVGFDGALLAEAGWALSDSWRICLYVRPSLTLFKDDGGTKVGPAFAGGISAQFLAR